MQVKHLKEQLYARGLPISGDKSVPIERLDTALNDNADVTDVSKIATPLLVPRATNNTRNNNKRRDAHWHEVPVNLVWILLEQE